MRINLALLKLLGIHKSATMVSNNNPLPVYLPEEQIIMSVQITDAALQMPFAYDIKIFW